MESTSRPGKIQLSAAAKEALLHACFVADLDAVLLDRGLLKVKGKGRCRVYTLRAIGANLSDNEWASGSSESSDTGAGSSAGPHFFARLGRDFSRALSGSLSDVGSAFFDSPTGSPIKLRSASRSSSGRRLNTAGLAGKRWGLAGRAILALGRWRKTGSEGRRRAAGRRERCEAGELEPRSPGFLPAVSLVANGSCASDSESEVPADAVPGAANP